MKTKPIVTFGEIMLRLSTPGYQRFTQAREFEIQYGGGEANVAVSLAQLGLQTFFITRLPDNDIGQAALNELRRYGVYTDYILIGGSRLGIYFLETGASQRPSKVIYDRAGSAIADVTAGMVDWDRIFTDAGWFHVTGITPALSPTAAEATLEALQYARKKSLTVSCDLNYRKKLWTREEAKRVMTEAVGLIDILVANEEDAEMVFGIKAHGSDVETGTIDTGQYKHVAIELMAMFPNLKYVAITLRESISAFDNIWSAVIWDGKEFVTSRKYNLHIVDRVGGGDSFCAGLIYAMVNGKTLGEIIEFAVGASCLKHTIHGDFNLTSAAEIKSLIDQGGSGRIQR
jgi:2-dehydro-3-deoxygluconokinase